MEMTRRSFLKSSAATGVATAAGLASAETVEETIASVKFIDIHAHVMEYPIAPQSYLSGRRQMCCPADQLGFWDAKGVEKGLVLGCNAPEMLMGGQSCESILRICRANPDRFIPSCCCDPRVAGNRNDTRFGEIFRYYRDLGCRSVGEIGANLHFLDPRVQNFFKGAEEAGLPLTFHVAADEEWYYGLVDQRGLPELEQSLQRFPKLKFLGHSQSFWCEISKYRTWDERTGFPKTPVEEGRLPELMRKYGNLYGDLSANSGNNALARDLDYAGRFLTEFQDRLLFGMDVCAPTGFISPLNETLAKLLRTGRITPAVYRKVARENAERVLGLVG